MLEKLSSGMLEILLAKNIIGHHNCDLTLGDILQENENKDYIYKIIGISSPYPNNRSTVDYLIEPQSESLKNKPLKEVANYLIGKSLFKINYFE